jgi:hypothetical protein
MCSFRLGLRAGRSLYLGVQLDNSRRSLQSAANNPFIPFQQHTVVPVRYTAPPVWWLLRGVSIAEADTGPFIFVASSATCALRAENNIQKYLAGKWSQACPTPMPYASQHKTLVDDPDAGWEGGVSIITVIRCEP